MAINAQAQKLNVASNLIARAGLLVDAYTQYQKWDNEYTKAGLTYAAGDFDDTALAHVDPAQIATLVTQLRAFKAWMDTAGNGDVFFKMQNGG
jgi:hypothetical protein